MDQFHDGTCILRLIVRARPPLNQALNYASRIYSPCPAAVCSTGIALRMNAPNIGTVNAVAP